MESKPETMKKIKTLSILIFSILLLVSCGTSHSVVVGGLFQKRKYNKGYHFSKKSNYKPVKKTVNEEIIFSSSDSANDTESSQEINLTQSETLITSGNEISSTETFNTEKKEVMVTEVDLKQTNKPFLKNIRTLGTHDLPHRDLMQKIVRKSPVKIFSKGSTSELSQSASDIAIILLVIIAIFIPPLAVFLYEGATSRFWIDLILAIIGWSVGWYLLGALAWLAGLLAVIYAILIVVGAI